MILDCGHEPSPHESFTTGYGIKDGKKYCYYCCAMQDLASMRTDGKIVLYFDKDKARVTNWPGSLSFCTNYPKISRHNWGLTRYDYWFVLDGYYWHGYTIGDFTQIAHCKRTKDMFTPQASSLIIPTHLIKGEAQ